MAGYLCDRDLYTLTRVSHRIACIASTLFRKKEHFIVIARQHSQCAWRGLPCPRCLAPVAKLFSDEAAGLLIQFRPRTRDCADEISAGVSWFPPAVPAHIFRLRTFDSHHVYLPGEPFEPVTTCSHFDGLF